MPQEQGQGPGDIDEIVGRDIGRLAQGTNERGTGGAAASQVGASAGVVDVDGLAGVWSSPPHGGERGVHGNAGVHFAPNVVDVRHPTASQQLADSVIWQLDLGGQEIRIRLNPRELGSMDVQLKLDGDKVSVRFDMADASVRDVVQISLPQLSAMLSSRGLALDQAQVFSQGGGQGAWQDGHGDGAATSSTGHHPNAPDNAVDGEAAQAVRHVLRIGAVDDYA